MNSRTFTMIKPEAVAAGHTADILKMISDNGFRIVALRMHHLSRNDAKRFYAVHQGKPFYEKLVEYMSSGPIVAIVLEAENAVAAFRCLVGATNPAEAAEGTIRQKFGTDKTMNAIHASDSDENARIEWQQHFDESDIML
ncbi:MAG: nucleoside-diphosphate kinase [Alistipes sp.]|nr:nucleoside-diphosphate kinase [Alistipes sp.]